MRTAVLLATLLFTALPAQAIPAADLARLHEQPYLSQSCEIEGLEGVAARFFVRVPAETCYRLLSDVTRLPEFMPGMKHLDVLEAAGDTMVVRLTGDGGELVQRRIMEPPHRIRLVLVRAPGLKDLRGYWALEPVEGGTVVTYALAVRPAMPVPLKAVSWWQEKRLPELVRNVRHRLESGGRWSKPQG